MEKIVAHIKTKTVNVRIKEELRNKLKAEAAERGITLEQLLEEKLGEKDITYK